MQVLYVTDGGKRGADPYQCWCEGQYPTVEANNLILSVSHQDELCRTAICFVTDWGYTIYKKNPCTIAEGWIRIVLYLILFRINMIKMVRWYARKCFHTRCLGSVVWFVVDSSRDVWLYPRHAGSVFGQCSLIAHAGSARINKTNYYCCSKKFCFLINIFKKRLLIWLIWWYYLIKPYWIISLWVTRQPILTSYSVAGNLCNFFYSEFSHFTWLFYTCATLVYYYVIVVSYAPLFYIIMLLWYHTPHSCILLCYCGIIRPTLVYPIKYYSSVSGGLGETKASIWGQGSICYLVYGSVKSTVLFHNFSHVYLR